MYQQYQNGSNQWFPVLKQGSCFTIKYRNTDFCKSKENTKKFINSIWSERHKILDQNALTSTINEDSLRQGDLYEEEQLIDIIMQQAAAFENFDVDGRHESHQILAIYNPDPRSQTRIRRNLGKLPEEISFLEIMNHMPNHSSNLMTSFNKALGGTNELKNQWVEIKNYQKEEYFSPAVDVSVMDWLSQKKKTAIIDRLQQVRKVMVNMDLPPVEGDFQEEIEETENELVGSIIDNLDKLIRIQKEKCVLEHIPKRLVGENCFPELAKLIAAKNKTMDICEVVSSTSDSMESWLGSWSSE